MYRKFLRQLSVSWILFSAEDARGVLVAEWDIPEDVPTWVKELSVLEQSFFLQECNKLYAGISWKDLRHAPNRPKQKPPARVFKGPQPQKKKVELQETLISFPSFENWKKQRTSDATPVPLQPGAETPRAGGEHINKRAPTRLCGHDAWMVFTIFNETFSGLDLFAGFSRTVLGDWPRDGDCKAFWQNER